MSYSRSLKKELIVQESKGLDEILGFFLTRDSFKENFILLRTPEMVRYVISLINKFTKARLEVNKSSKIYFDTSLYDQMNERIGEIKKKINRDNININKGDIKDKKSGKVSKEQKVNILRGIFLSSGCCPKPESSYGIEIKFDSEENLDFFISLFSEYKIHKNRHKGAFRAILRKYEDILDILFNIGAKESFFDYEEINIIKGIRAKNNRETNLEIANNDRRAASFALQIEAIDKISKSKVKLDEDLLEVIDARKKYPDLSLQDLADKINVSRSTVKLKLAKIKKLAEEI